MSDALPDLSFPCKRFDADRPELRLLGLYPQAQEGLWMQRIKVLGGRLTAEQWRALADVARQLSPTAPLHLTTRQDVELHDLTAEAVPGAQEALAGAGLTGLGAGGDSLRNITVCPCSGTASGTVDLVPLAWRMRRMLEATEGIYALPRKFKISLSACEGGCGQPWINDVGLVAHRRRGAWCFEVIVAGSLGVRPRTGMLLYEAMAPEDVLPCVRAMVRLFAAHGDRDHRGAARLRHVRERVGDDRFAGMARAAVSLAKAEQPWPDVALPEAADGFDARLPLTFANGDVTANEAAALAALAGRDEVRVRIANHHRVIVFGRDEKSLAAAVGQWPALRAAATAQPAIVACPGRRRCRHGLVDTGALARRLRAQWPANLAPATTLCISGCPNGCAHSGIADIGLVGVRVSADGGPREAYHLYTGGGMGRDDRLALPAGRKLSADAVLARIAAHPAPA